MNGVAANAPSRAASASGLPPSARPVRRRVATGVPAYSAARPRALKARGVCPPGDAGTARDAPGSVRYRQRPGQPGQRPRGQHGLVQVPGDLPAERPVDRHRGRVQDRQRVATFGHELGERGHHGAADALAAVLGRDLDTRHPGHGDRPPVPPLAQVVVQRAADQLAAVERAQAPAGDHGRLDRRPEPRLVQRPERAHGQVQVGVPAAVGRERTDDHVSGQPSFSMMSSATE